MLLVGIAAAVLPSEQAGNPALTSESSINDGRSRAEQLQNEGKELWEGAVRAAGGFDTGGAADIANVIDVLSGLHAPGSDPTDAASALASGSMSLVVNQTSQCSHLVPLDAKFHTSLNTNRHKYNAGQFGPRAPQTGFAEFLGPHQTAEWFGVHPSSVQQLSLHKKQNNGHDAVRIASITLDKAMYISSLDMAGLPVPNGAFYPQITDPQGYPRPLYLAPHTGVVNVTITEANGKWTVHQINLNGTAWENGQLGTWRRLKVGRQVKEIKFAGGSESTWAVKNVCGADATTAIALALEQTIKNKTMAREADQAQAAFKTAEAELQSTRTDLHNKHSALKEAKQHLKLKRTDLVNLDSPDKLPIRLEEAKSALKAETDKLNANRAELVQDLQKVGAKEHALAATLLRHEEKARSQHQHQHH